MKQLVLTIVLIISLGTAIPGLARKSDRAESIHFDAGQMTADVKKGITIYTGDVTIDQGTLHISADRVKVISSDNEVLQLIASMHPDSESLAHYEQESDNNEGLVSADAKKITYFLQEERIHLSGNARLNQKENIFSGELLHYDLGKGIVDLKSGGDNRVNIVLKPKTK